MLDKKSIISAVDLPSETVSVPEWGGDVKVTALSAKAMEAFQASIRDPDGNLTSNIREKFLVVVMIDDKGNRLFEDEDYLLLAEKNPAVMDKVFAVAQRLNGIGEEAKAKIAKN